MTFDEFMRAVIRLRIAASLFLAGWLLGGHARAEDPCPPAKIMGEALKNQYGEVAAFAGAVRAVGGQQAPAGMAMFVTLAPSGTWTVVVRHADGSACIVSAGDGGVRIGAER